MLAREILLDYVGIRRVPLVSPPRNNHPMDVLKFGEIGLEDNLPPLTKFLRLTLLTGICYLLFPGCLMGGHEVINPPQMGGDGGKARYPQSPLQEQLCRRP